MQNYQKQNKKQNNDIWFFGENNFAFMMIYDYHPNIIKPIQLNNFHQTTEIEKIIITNFVIIIHEQNYQAIEYSQNLPKPQKIEIENIQKVSVGAFHLAILTKEGKAFAKGKYVNTKNPDIFNNLSDSIEDPNEIIIQDIVCGQISIYLLTSNQNAYGIGSNIFGQIGFDSQQVFNNPILMMKNVSKIFSGKFANHVFLLNSNQELFVCGNNDYSQLGLGKIKEKEVKKLTKIQNIPKGKIIDIQSGFYHTIMLIEQKGTRKLYSCGNYEYTGLGKKKNTSEFTGIKSPLFKNDNILDFSVGWNHTLVLTANGKLIGFGWNSHGQLGIGNTRDQPKPIQIKIPEISSNISNYHICCGFHNSFLYYSSPSFSNLEEDLIKLFRRKEFCDISFKAQNEEIIEAHKLILKYRLKDQNQNQKLQKIISKKSVQESNKIFEMIYSNIIINSKLYSEIKEIINEERINETMKSIYLNENEKDFIIERNENQIKFPKLILIMRSELYRGMFLSVTNDKSNKVTDYSELSNKSFQIFEYWIYSNQIKKRIQITQEIINELKRGIDYFQLNQTNPNLLDLLIKKFNNQKIKRKRK